MCMCVIGGVVDAMSENCLLKSFVVDHLKSVARGHDVASNISQSHELICFNYVDGVMSSPQSCVLGLVDVNNGLGAHDD